jgi:hypothetical protein
LCPCACIAIVAHK